MIECNVLRHSIFSSSYIYQHYLASLLSADSRHGLYGQGITFYVVNPKTLAQLHPRRPTLPTVGARHVRDPPTCPTVPALSPPEWRTATRASWVILWR